MEQIKNNEIPNDFEALSFDRKHYSQAFPSDKW